VTANICANWASTVDDAPLSGSRSDAPESPTGGRHQVAGRLDRAHEQRRAEADREPDERLGEERRRRDLERRQPGARPLDRGRREQQREQQQDAGAHLHRDALRRERRGDEQEPGHAQGEQHERLRDAGGEEVDRHARAGRRA
jgi:hypothetical protein